jgi:hypothetical protein
MVLEAAVNGRADAIVTFNRKDYGEAWGRSESPSSTQAKLCGRYAHDHQNDDFSPAFAAVP